MRLGIVTDCTHYVLPGGDIATENHILLRQFQQLASHFDHTVICCPVAAYDSSKVITAYHNPNISFIKLPLVGGDSASHKLKLITAIPRWLKAFRQLGMQCEVIYQRFPNNLNIPGFFYFWLKKKKVFATYTGTWKQYHSEPFTYKLQRWVLRLAFRGPVWVYTDQQPANARLKPGFSPSYSTIEWQEEARQVQQRIDRLKAEGIGKLKMMTVGSLIDYKNQGLILKACKSLQENKVDFHLTVVGDGPMRSQLEQFVSSNRLTDHVFFAGKKTHVELRQLYREHDVVVQAPLKEGFGKVPIEGFFHGAVPVISNVGVSKMILAGGERGFIFDPHDEQSLAVILMNIQQQPRDLVPMIEAGRNYARTQTLEAWADEYYKTVTAFYSEV